MYKRAAVLCALYVLAVALPAHEQQNTVGSCRQIRDSTARLACYDALPLTAETKPQAVPAGPGTRAMERAETPRVGEATVESAVSSDFAGWGPNERIALENGQVWQIADGSTYATQPGRRKAAVRFGILGAQFLDIEGVALSPRVRRIK